MLEDLEATGRYLFHGSDIVSDKLLPQRALNRGQRDSRARVFASTHSLLAVFHALARTAKRTHPHLKRSLHGFSIDNGRIALRSQSGLLEAVRKLTEPTNVYVFGRAQFSRKNDLEWQTERTVAPLGVVFVRGRDLAPLLRPGMTIEQIEET